MAKQKRNKNVLLSALIVLACAVCSLVSCSSDGCTNNLGCVPKAGFYSNATKNSVMVDSITIYGVGVPGDSMLTECGRVTSVYLPLRMSTDMCQYVFHYDQKAISNPLFNDTITFHYDVVPYFESSECGAIVQFDITDFTYTRHVIDSVAVPFTHITNVDVETVKIFFRTSER